MCQLAIGYSPGLYTLSSEAPTTRARVLAATLALVERAEGPLTMGAIAKAAGLSRQALYLIFEDKADLFIALLRYADGQRGLVKEAARIRDASSGAEALAGLVDLVSRFNPDRKPLADAFELLRRQDSAAEQAWQDRQRHRLEGCKAVVARLGQEGRLRAGLTPAVATDLMWSMTSFSLWDDLVIQRGWSTEAYRERLTALLLEALLG